MTVRRLCGGNDVCVCVFSLSQWCFVLNRVEHPKRSQNGVYVLKRVEHPDQPFSLNTDADPLR